MVTCLLFKCSDQNVDGVDICYMKHDGSTSYVVYALISLCIGQCKNGTPCPASQELMGMLFGVLTIAVVDNAT